MSAFARFFESTKAVQDALHRFVTQLTKYEKAANEVQRRKEIERKANNDLKDTIKEISKRVNDA